MNKYLILCIDDEREVLDSVLNDLTPFEKKFDIEAAESAEEAQQIIKELEQENIHLALVLCDHIMPEVTGVEFLKQLNNNPATTSARKLLLTGQAGLSATIDAVNHASLDFYIAKPWQGDALQNVIRDQLTTFIIEHESNLLPWASVLNSEQIYSAMNEKRTTFS